MDTEKVFAYTKHDKSCPVCDCNYLCVVVEGDESYYKCGDCSNDWIVIGD